MTSENRQNRYGRPRIRTRLWESSILPTFSGGQTGGGCTTGGTPGFDQPLSASLSRLYLPQRGGHGPWANHGSLAPGGGLWLAPLEVDTAPGHGRLPVARGTPPSGANTAARGSLRGSPDGPPNLGFVLVSFTGTFTDILGSSWLVN